ncbi:SRPBCC family protein [Promicromonospora sp. NFX87]|uniref:SRPBCC family protein n=1 Tax=Promicromonospora sp. NFX87 TaxID=3402691 RepID=UPI003AFAB17E
MSETQSYAPVVAEVTVPAGQARAFELFTVEHAAWLAEGHWLGGERPAAIVFEPTPGGRWYERQPDGTECDWGRVLEWSAPGRLVLAWMLDGDWRFDPDVERASRVEVTFTEVGPDQTVLRLVHTGFEARGAGGGSVHRGVGSADGWQAYLDALVAFTTP